MPKKVDIPTSFLQDDLVEIVYMIITLEH